MFPRVSTNSCVGRYFYNYVVYSAVFVVFLNEKGRWSLVMFIPVFDRRSQQESSTRNWLFVVGKGACSEGIYWSFVIIERNYKTVYYALVSITLLFVPPCFSALEQHLSSLHFILVPVQRCDVEHSYPSLLCTWRFSRIASVSMATHRFLCCSSVGTPRCSFQAGCVLEY